MEDIKFDWVKYETGHGYTAHCHGAVCRFLQVSTHGFFGSVTIEGTTHQMKFSSFLSTLEDKMRAFLKEHLPAKE